MLSLTEFGFSGTNSVSWKYFVPSDFELSVECKQRWTLKSRIKGKSNLNNNTTFLGRKTSYICFTLEDSSEHNNKTHSLSSTQKQYISFCAKLKEKS